MPEKQDAHGTCFDAESMAEARRERSWKIAWLIAATVVHGALLSWLFVVPLRARGSADASAAPGETEIALLVNSDGVRSSDDERGARAAQERVSLPAALGAVTAPATIAAGSIAAAATASSSVPTGARGSESGSSEVRGGAPSASASGAGGTTAPMTAEQLGIAGIGPRNPFLPRAEVKEPTGPRVMRGTGGERDRDLGLGPEGPAIAALSEATTSSIAPHRGRASFVVRAGGDGLVFAVDLVDAEGGPGWADAGRIALQHLRGKKMRIPQGAHGLNMHIEVRSEMKLPNGENAPFGVRPGENQMPEMTIPDVSNLGAKPRRVIHARATGTEVL